MKLFSQLVTEKRNIINKVRCKKNHAPMNCLFEKNCSICNTTFEGNSRISEGASIRSSHIGYGTHVAAGSKIINCKIGKYCAVGFQAMLGAHPIHTVASIHPALYSTQGQYGFTYVTNSTFQEFHYIDEEKKISIEIGNDVWVTAGKATTIIQGITIGDGAVVLGNAMVTKNVPPYAIVGGIPAKVVGYRFSEEQIVFLLKLRWWDRPEEWIRAHAKYFANIELLMRVVFKEEPELLEKENML